MEIRAHAKFPDGHGSMQCTHATSDSSWITTGAVAAPFEGAPSGMARVTLSSGDGGSLLRDERVVEDFRPRAGGEERVRAVILHE